MTTTLHEHIANLLVQGHHQGWLVYQFEIHHRFQGLKHTLWHLDKYRMTCSGFRTLTHKDPTKLLMKVTCKIREVKGYMYPAP